MVGAANNRHAPNRSNVATVNRRRQLLRRGKDVSRSTAGAIQVLSNYVEPPVLEHQLEQLRLGFRRKQFDAVFAVHLLVPS
jgi:hypothetical protein